MLSLATPWKKPPLKRLSGKFHKVCLLVWHYAYFRSDLWYTGDAVAPASGRTPNASRIYIRRRFQFSSALKRMSTVSTLPSGKALVAVKGAPETIKRMLAHVPEWYDETFKWYTRRGSRVLALGTKEMDSMSIDKVPFSLGALAISI